MSALLDISASELRSRFGNTRADGSLGDLLKAKCHELYRKPPSETEITSWNQSLPALAEALDDFGLGHLVMFIELDMPPWPEQADVILAGPGHDNGRPVFTLVELKQWTDFEVLPSGRVMAGWKQGGPASKQHPWGQVTGHARYLAELYAVLDHDSFSSAVFLHNATDDFMQRLRNFGDGRNSTMFGAGELADFAEFLKGRYSDGSSAGARRMLLNARVRQSEALLKRVAAEFDETADKRFVLIGEQQEAHELVAQKVKELEGSERKAAVIVHGRAGTGKTAIALKLAGEYFLQDEGVYYWTWHQAFREALKKNSGLSDGDAKQIFRSPREKKITNRNMRLSATVSICDEAHRLEERTSLRSHSRESDQIDDILWTSRVHVFFVDDDQQMKTTEIGTVDRLRSELEERHVSVDVIELETQFRSAGTREYIDWVRRMVGHEPKAPELWRQREDFKLWIAERPQEVERILRAVAGRGDRYRMTAGLCWKSTDDGFGFVEIGDWRKQWNLEQASGDGPKSIEWGWKEGGWKQIGCVHTAQGLDWEWAGVIIGRDLVLRDTLATPLPENNTNVPTYANRPDDRRISEKLIRNAYYVLMTRGMKGMVIYAEDNLLRAELRGLVEPLPLPEGAEPEDKWERLRRKLPQETIDVVYEAQRAGSALPHKGLDYVPGHHSEYAWRDQLIAVLPDGLGHEAALEAETAYAEAGWTARRESDWDPESLRSALLSRLAQD
ncbi:DNA/RNA helicase domain-containing protein [Glycomyces salinus]|uniref:DNA/RNA helicase domain-containing protein n=1 Tax=Glycomyces salinus TaxID=980294 RepID=UPI0018EC56F6|nr:DNA/RNA helicase domain-containing protein [Glycomyces salinus]